MNAVPSMSPEEYAGRFRMIDPRVAHRGMGGFGYCVDCGATRPGSGLCPPKRQDHPIIWAREDQTEKEK